MPFSDVFVWALELFPIQQALNRTTCKEERDLLLEQTVYVVFKASGIIAFTLDLNS